MGLGMHARLMVGWMGTFSSRFWMMNFKKLLLIMAKLLRTLSFRKIITLNMPAKRPMNGSKIMDSLFYNGLQSLQTLNPIEHFWEHIKRRLGEYETPPGGMLELWERVEAEWDNKPAEVCQNLIKSMPRRIEAVLKAKGGYTKY